MLIFDLNYWTEFVIISSLLRFNCKENYTYARCQYGLLQSYKRAGKYEPKPKKLLEVEIRPERARKLG